LRGPIYIVGDRGAAYRRILGFDRNEMPTNLIEYGGGAGQTEKRPWLFTNKRAYYLESNHQVKPLYLRELEELQHPDNGKGATVNDVYLYFNIAETVQRYYSGQLESIGPDRGYGLPQGRRGIPISAASYPDKVVYAIDADDGTSSILAFNNIGWHELYRGRDADERIRNVHVKGRADTADRIYFSEGADVGYIYASINPETEAGYKYTHESVLETGRIYAGQRGLEKYFHSVELVTEDLDSTTTIEVDYKTSANTTWTPIGTTFNTSPRQKEVLSSDYDVTGSWIQLRVRMYTEDEDVTPVLVAIILEAIARQDVNYSYSVNVRLPVEKYQDLNGRLSSATGDTNWDQIQTWIDGVKPVIISSVNKDLDGEVCTIEPVTNYRLVTKQIGGDKLAEVRMFTLNLLQMVT